MPRPAVVTLVFLLVAGGIGSLTFGVLHDLDNEVRKLKEAAPEAAAEIEDGDGFIASTARDIHLEDRVRTAVEDLEQPSSGVAAGVATSVGAWVVGAVLTIFLLSWGPRLASAGLGQIADEDRRRRVAHVVRVAAGNGRRYVLGTLALALLSGAVATVVCTIENVPASIALGVTVAAGSVVPGAGIVLGALPAVLLEAGLGTGMGAVRLAVIFLALQLAHEVALRRFVISRSLVVGPAVVVIALVLGFEIYGVGGAYYGAALATFGVAALDAVGRHRAAEREVEPDGEAGLTPSS
jgi:predicted PurR-regulated permease PerM